MNVALTNDPSLESWIPVPSQSDFPIQNLPYGAFERGGIARLGVALGERVVDLYELAQTGLLDDAIDREVLQAPVLNPLMAAGRDAWQAVRARLSELLRAGGDPALRELNADHIVIDRRDLTMRVPSDIGDYVDFYSSLEHATNLGALFRPGADPLLPNWRWIPIGYHGRSSTIVSDGTPIVRPRGQRKASDASLPTFGPSLRLDIELEIGFFTGPGNAMGTSIPASAAAEHIFGLVLVNDWSARDIQAWEYQPLGPFLGKSFATTISPWVVTIDALEPFRSAGPTQDPQPLPYLRVDAPWSFDVQLAVDLQTAAMRESGIDPHTISRTTFKNMYWNMAQQLAHASVNGTAVRPGDLYASGTISGAAPDSLGSFIELSWNGTRPIALPNGQSRTFLEDGDAVTLRGWCEAPGAARIGFGRARGAIAQAIPA